MPPRLPDLWKLKLDDAEILYERYLCQLMINDQNVRTVQACRAIRRYAARGPGSQCGLLTFRYELEALCTMDQLDAALKQARLRDRIKYGKTLNYAKHQWDEADGVEGYWLIYTMAPLHYYNQRYQLGCHLLETGLGFWFNHDNPNSYEWLSKIVPLREDWRYLQTASLTMFYRKLGKDLRTWKHWNRFVDGFPARFYRVVGISKSELRDDPKLLRDLMKRIRHICHENRSCYVSGCSNGIHDIIDTPQQIKRFHERILLQKQRQRFARGERRASNDQRLMELFPELRNR